MWWHGLGCVAIKMGTSDIEEKLSWLMEWNGWGASFRFPPLPALNSNLRQCRSQRQWSVTCLILRKMLEVVNNMTWALECFLQSAAHVLEYRKWLNVHYMMVYAKLIIVHVKHGHRSWCEYMQLCAVDLPTQVQATFPVEIWLERGQYHHTFHGF